VGCVRDVVVEVRIIMEEREGRSSRKEGKGRKKKYESDESVEIKRKSSARKDGERRKKKHESESDVSEESLESRGRSSTRRDRKRRKKKYESDVSDSSEDGRGRSSSRKDRKRDKDRKERKRLRKEKRKDKERRRNKEESEELSSGSEVDADVKPEDVVTEIYSNFPNEAKDLGQVWFFIELLIFSEPKTTGGEHVCIRELAPNFIFIFCGFVAAIGND
jgi:hypothetical protein